MKFSVLTLFPEMFSPILGGSILGRAVQHGLLEFDVRNIRSYTLDKHGRVDDYPFGGGAGLVMTPQPLFDAIDAVKAGDEQAPVVYLSPKGEPMTQALFAQLAVLPHLVLVCGHYEGVDERVLQSKVDREISLGDFVLTGGELPALALIDGVSRLVPGVLGGGEESHAEESFYDGLLEYPQYTRPADFRGMEVPPVLLSGNHAEIAKWRREQALALTRARRPELLKPEK